MNTTERQEKIIQSVQSQSDAGFSSNEVLKNLMKEGFTKEEVEPYLKNVSEITSSQRQSLQVFLMGIAIFCCVKALDNTGPAFDSNPGKFWGFAGGGLFAFLLFLLMFRKRNPFK
jgi:hypothetical protein